MTEELIIPSPSFLALSFLALSFLAALALGIWIAKTWIIRRLSPFLIKRHDVHLFFSHGKNGNIVCDTVIRMDLRNHRKASTLRLPMFIADPAPTDGESLLQQWHYGVEILQNGQVEKIIPQPKLADSRALLLSFSPLPRSRHLTVSQHFSHTFVPWKQEHEIHLHTPFPTRQMQVTFHFHNIPIQQPVQMPLHMPLQKNKTSNETSPDDTYPDDTYPDDTYNVALKRQSPPDWHNPSRFVYESHHVAAGTELRFSWKWPKSLPIQARENHENSIQQRFAQLAAQTVAFSPSLPPQDSLPKQAPLSKQDNPKQESLQRAPLSKQGTPSKQDKTKQSKSAEDHPIIRAARARGAGIHPSETAKLRPSKR